MAKIIDFTPHHQNSSEDDMMMDFLKLLRAVVDGDEEAREELRSMLDMYERTSKNAINHVA